VQQVLAPLPDSVRAILDKTPLRRVGHVLFRFARVDEAPRATLGAFFFFDRVGFITYTEPEGEVADPLASQRRASQRSTLWVPGSQKPQLPT
jgi:hypothetical protein